MVFSFTQSLNQLASLRSYEYLSTTPGFTGRPVLGGTLYVHIALGALLGGRVPCLDSEREEVTNRVVHFLEENKTNFQTRDLPALTRIEFNMRRMGADRQYTITNIYSNVWRHFFPESSPTIAEARDAEEPEEETARESKKHFTEHDEDDGLPLKRPLKEKEPSSSSDAAPSAPPHGDYEMLSPPASEEIPSAYDMPSRPASEAAPSTYDMPPPAASTAALEEEDPSTLTSPEEMPQDVAVQPSSFAAPLPLEAIVIPNLSQSEIAQALRETNTCWFLSLPLPAREHCENLYLSLYKKSASALPLAEEEWILLTKCMVLLLRENLNRDLLSQSQELFLRYYLCHNRNNALPEELLALLHLTAPHTHVLELVSFLRTSAAPPSSGSEPDPNACILLKHFLDEFAAIKWQESPISITGFTSARPWRTEKTDLTDKELITQMCQNLSSHAASSLREHLDSINIVLLFALSSHTFRENGSFRQSFKKLAKAFLPILESFGKIPPKDATESDRYKNFCRLYHFFVGSRFMTRLTEEERYKSSWEKHAKEKSESSPALLKDRYSLWGSKDTSATPAGNTEKNFELSSLLSSLEDVRQVAVHESKRKKEGRDTAIVALFTMARAAPSHIPATERRFSWADLFHEPTGDAKKEWTDGQEQALRCAQQIAEEFNHLTPPIDFESVVKAAQRGGETLKRFLHMYSDKGLVLLRDYVYPYVVLMKRATTPFDHTARKFIGCAASSEEIISLCEKEEATYVAVLQNVLGLMRRDGEDGPGGALKDSVIHSSQINMLSQMIRCIQSKKTVFICNETGSGKTTMSKLAPQIVAFHVPIVLHVAPFTQFERGWERLTSWETLNKIKTTETSHFWITAADLAKLMADGIAQKYQQLLQKTFFLMDEYDSQEYFFSSKDEDSIESLTSIQDELFFRYNCPRVVNMSATPNLETFETLIAHYTKKIADADKPEVKEYYSRKIGALKQQGGELLSNMSLEWKRTIDLQDLPPSAGKDSNLHISAVFKDIRAFPFDASRGTSLLVEVPQFTLSPEYALQLQKHMSQAFGTTASAILFRDTNGFVQAHHTTDGTTWAISSLEEFTKTYPSLEKKPVVVCFYSQDSVGGDFDIFSNERLVRGQYIVYSDKIAPSYAIFQNMRRQRRNLSARTAIRESAPSETPVKFYLGPNVSTFLQLSPQEQHRISKLTPENQAHEVNSARKETLFSEATRLAANFSHVREQARLKRKVIRKKQLLLKEVLKEDAKKLSQLIETELKDLPKKTSVAAFFQSTLLSLIEDISLPLDADIEKVRNNLLSQAIALLHGPILNPIQSEGPFQENEALCLLLDIFGGPTGLEKILASEDAYGDITRILTRLYGKRPRSCIELFMKPLEAHAKQKRDPLLHPVPSPDAIGNALRQIRLGTHEGIPDIAADIDPGPERHGVAPLPPDLMVKALIGTNVRDQSKAKKFCQRLKTEATKAQSFQKEQGEKLAALQQRIAFLKKTLLKCIELTSLPSIAALAHTSTNPSIQERAHQLDLYLDTYQLYTGSS